MAGDVVDVEDVEELPGDVVAEIDRGRTIRAETVRVVRIEGWRGRDSEGRGNLPRRRCTDNPVRPARTHPSIPAQSRIFVWLCRRQMSHV